MELDARGFACPQPVLMAKAELEKIEEGVVTVLVDNKGSCINVKNFCEANGHSVTVTEKDGYFQLDVAKGFDCAVAEEAPGKGTTVLHISGESMGCEEPELGKKLMRGFLCNLKNLDNPPQTVIFVNNSVRLTTENDETVSALNELADMGVEILSCGICLEHYKLVDKLRAGSVTDAHTVGNKLFNADKVIRM